MSKKYLDQFLQQMDGAGQDQKPSTVKLDAETLALVQHWQREMPGKSVRELSCWLIRVGHEAALDVAQSRNAEKQK